MPTYTYRCRDCENEFEKRQRMSEDPLTICPTCGGSIRRVVNSVGILFKGSGFYVTDNRKSQSTGAALSKKDDDGKSDAPATKTNESGGDTKKSSGEKEAKSANKATA